jgi:hypothetical protein
MALMQTFMPFQLVESKVSADASHLTDILRLSVNRSIRLRSQCLPLNRSLRIGTHGSGARPQQPVPFGAIHVRNKYGTRISKRSLAMSGEDFDFRTVILLACGFAPIPRDTDPPGCNARFQEASI